MPRNYVKQGSLIYIIAGGEQFMFDTHKAPIGQGAMGTVFAGNSCSDGRKVAIKMVNPAYADIPSVRNRAREEAMLRFRHPNLIETIGLCEPAPTGPIFIVSNFVTGIPMDEHVARNLRPLGNYVERVCRAMFPVLDALSYLHTGTRPVYHLDIKPSNIMVENGNSNVRLMDLGIAFTRDTHDITSAGLLGTPGYAAPEQNVEVGQPLSVNATTDLYEFAVTLYELLAGHKPHDNSSPDPIPGVKRQLMEVLSRAMAESQSSRYGSARELKAAIAEALAAKESNNRRMIWISVAAAVAAVAAGVAAALII
ncbi:MAG: serine/threonine protein kinase [Pseudoflavonifractor sp.]|nr:serine/threonine protein kinase [Alloprevotella sp.]MCM1116864.1 serine/threonine protein kinase [Pseudoflavonifractor sp.]